MTCVVCKNGKTQSGKITVTFDREGTTVVIRNVPAEICTNCHEEYVNEETTKTLLKTAESVAKAGALVDVREYMAA